MALRRRILLTMMVMLSFTLMTVGTASAKKKSNQKNTGLSAVLGEIEWGDSKAEVLDKMKTQLMAEAKEDAKAKRDPVLLQKARKKALSRYKAADKSYTKLEGTDTGYEVSVIADEFSVNNGESFIRVKDRVAQRFYFFVDGGLYKLVVAYNGSYLRDTDFETFVAVSARKYGRPTSAEYDDIRGEEQLALVTWEDRETSLAVKNKKELFDTYTMAFSDRQTLKRLASQKRRVGGNDKDEEELSATVQDLATSSDTDGNSAIVDQISGGKTNIDFNEGRPKDDQMRRYDEDGNVVAEGEEPEKKKKQQKKKKKKKRKKKNAPDFSKIKANTDDDLIIY